MWLFNTKHGNKTGAKVWSSESKKLIISTGTEI